MFDAEASIFLSGFAFLAGPLQLERTQVTISEMLIY